jgi:hypothetical protein
MICSSVNLDFLIVQLLLRPSDSTHFWITLRGSDHPDYHYREGWGWYLPPVRYGRLTCGEARRIVRRSGFRNISTIECRGRTYTFEATRRGRDVIVYVNSRTGDVWRG